MNVAIVIGINEYVDAKLLPQLETPVGDALRMAQWLTNPARGNVPPSNLLLFVSPLPPVTPAVPGVGPNLIEQLRGLGNLFSATHENILRQVTSVPARVQKGDRLYLYYAGHGLSSRIQFTNEDAIISADYDKIINLAIMVSSIEQFFKGYQFADQYLIFDCCRNRLNGEILLSQLPPNDPPPGLDVSQYVINATAPGSEAVDGRGRLTEVLLDGLNGVGRAKLWDPQRKNYVVRISRLGDYLIERFNAIPASDKTVGDGLIQTPRIGGEHRPDDRVVVAIPEAEVPPVPLTVSLSPDPAVNLLLRNGKKSIQLASQGAPTQRQELDAHPVTLPLKPRLYFLSIDAPVGYQECPNCGVDLYEPMSLPIALELLGAAEAGGQPPGNSAVATAPPTTPPSQPPPVTPPPPTRVSVPIEGPGLTPANVGPVAFGLAAAPANPVTVPPQNAPDAPPDSGVVTIRADDPVAPLELLDEAGGPVHRPDGPPFAGTGELVATGLPPGFYRARLMVPEGGVTEKVVHVEAGRRTVITLAAPKVPGTGLIEKLLQDGGFEARTENNLVELSGRVAATAPTVSTVLSLASAATKRGLGWDEDGGRLRQIGLKTVAGQDQGPGEGIEVLLATELMAASVGPLVNQEKVAAYLRGVRVCVWPLDQGPGPTRPPEMSDTAGVASFAQLVSPGAYQLSVGTADGGIGAILAATVLPGRTTQFVLHQQADGQIRVYLNISRPDTHPDTLRRLDMAERFLAVGKIRHARLVLDPLLGEPTLDPVAAIVLGAIFFREWHTDPTAVKRIEPLTERLIREHPGLPDAHVLRARFLELAKKSCWEVIKSYQTALDLGIPLLASSVTRLASGLGETAHRRKASLKDIAARLIPGLLWAATPFSHSGPSAQSPNVAEGNPLSFSIPTVPQTVTSAGGNQAPAGIATRNLPLSSQGAQPMSTPTAPNSEGLIPANISPASAPQNAPAQAPRLRPSYCSNLPNGGPFDPTKPSGVTKRAAADTSRLWTSRGVSTLRVGFMNGTDAWGQTVRQAIQKYAVEWSLYANLPIEFATSGVHVAVNLVPFGSVGVGTYNSWIGTDCLAMFQQGQPSINLVFDPQLQTNPAFMEQEFQRVIRHEFGHAIGMVHEHMRPNRGLNWDMNGLRAYYGGPPNNWSDQMIQDQITSFYTNGPLSGTAFDITSIMMYQFPAGLAVYDDGTPFQSPNNIDLSPEDKVLANILYPATGVTDPDEVVLQPGQQAIPVTISTPGQVARFRAPIQNVGAYAIATQSTEPLLIAILPTRKDPGNELFAVEGVSASLAFRANQAKDYFVEIRHATPMTMTATFNISLRSI